jgi:hypothetical protein
MQTQVTVDRIRFGLVAAAFAFAALSASAGAAPYVPPGNSAANQYTEAVPTAGGPKATDKGKQGQGRSPSKVLGARNTAKLDAQGAQGRATAELAAATAPVAVGESRSASAQAPPRSGGGPQDAGGQSPHRTAPRDRATGAGQTGDGASQAEEPRMQDAGGSSGFGEVIGHATGSSSGELGLLFPLLILAVVIWSVAYVLRQRRGHPVA